MGTCCIKLFTVRNGVKQGCVLLPILFAIYTNSILKRLEESGVGCHMGRHFTGVLAHTDFAISEYVWVENFK